MGYASQRPRAYDLTLRLRPGVKRSEVSGHAPTIPDGFEIWIKRLSSGLVIPIRRFGLEPGP